MISPVTSAIPAEPTTAASPVPSDSKHLPVAQRSSGEGHTDTVHLSSAAQAQLSAAQAAVQEATETSAQTAKEARTGDLQAQHLLTREAQSAQSNAYTTSASRPG